MNETDPRVHNQELIRSPENPPTRPRRPMWRRALARALFVPTGLMFRRWRKLSPPQQVVLGYVSYVMLGFVLLWLPWAQAVPVAPIDNLFGVTSAISTTGLVTVATGDSYTFFGELVHVLLFQVGGIGYMTVSSFVILARGGTLSRAREGILKAGFALPTYFRVDRFIVHVVVYAVIVETIGTAALWWEFSSVGEPRALWSAMFHCVSAFATAGFGLHSNSLENYAGNPAVNLTIGVLSYLGAIGFIVVQDVYYSIRYREHMITFSSKVILTMTAAIFVLASPLFFFVEPSIREMELGDRVVASAFQVMTASTTAGFNTVPVGPLSLAALWLIVILMLIGASPSGTGGGIKTTTVSALFATGVSIVRGRRRVTLLGNEIPLLRLLTAVAATGFYVGVLSIGVLLLCLSEREGFLEILFEAASGLGTVGLSMGITPELSTFGKFVIIVLMFAGRVGPLTLGLALLRPAVEDNGTSSTKVDDLAV